MANTFSEHVILLESQARIDALRKKHDAGVREYYKGIARYPVELERAVETFHREIVEVDPTNNKIYLDWLYRQGFRVNFWEDDAAITSDLELYERVKRQMPVAERDINHFITYYDLRRALAVYTEIKSNREIKKQEIAEWKAQITTVYDGSDGKLLVPNTYGASKFLGRGTKWCTAMETNVSHFVHYTNHGPLWVCIFPNGSRYQLWAPPFFYASWNLEASQSVQWMNEQDIPSNIGFFFRSPMWAALRQYHKWDENRLTLARYQWDVRTGIEILRGNSHLHDVAVHIVNPIPYKEATSDARYIKEVLAAIEGKPIDYIV